MFHLNEDPFCKVLHFSASVIQKGMQFRLPPSHIVPDTSPSSRVYHAPKCYSHVILVCGYVAPMVDCLSWLTTGTFHDSIRNILKSPVNKFLILSMDFFYGLILMKMLAACFQYFSLLYMVWYLVIIPTPLIQNKRSGYINIFINHKETLEPHT